MIQKRNLVLITAMFPYGKRETYLENEIKHLSDGFRSVLILPHSVVDTSQRAIPSNCTTRRLKLSEKGRKFSFCDIGVIAEEILYIFSNYNFKLWLRCLRTLRYTYLRAKAALTTIETVVQAQESTVFYSYWLDEYALALAFAKKYKSVKTAVSRAHNWDIYFELHPTPYLPFRQFILSSLSQTYSISYDGKKYLVNKTSELFSDKISVARLGTLNVGRQKNPIRTSPGLVLCSCSTLIKRKRISLIIDSILSLDTHLPVTWFHIGEEGEEKDYLFHLCRTKSTSTRQLIMLGHKENKDISSFYVETPIDLFINLSSSEGVPVSIMEANSFGIPAIATDTGGTREIVIDKVNGYLLPVNTFVTEVTKVIENYMTLDSAEVKSMRENAFIHWDKKFNSDKNYSDFVATLNSL